MTDKLGLPAPLMVKRSRHLRPAGNCYWNVDAVVRHSGGSVVHGWLLRVLDGLLVEAMHHAVWRTPQDDLFDVTDDTSVSLSNRSAFVPDARIQIDLERMPFITNRSLLLVAHPLLDKATSLYQQRNALQREQANLLWDLGYRCEAQFARAIGEQANVDASILENEMILKLEHSIHAVGQHEDYLMKTLIAGLHRS